MYSSRLYVKNPVFEIVHEESVKVYHLHLYNGNIQQNSLCVESCVTEEFHISPRFSLHLRLPAAVAELAVYAVDEHHAGAVLLFSVRTLPCFLAKCANLCDSVSLLLEGVAVPVSGTRVLKSKGPRARRVVEALVVGTLGGVKFSHSSTPT